MYHDKGLISVGFREKKKIQGPASAEKMAQKYKIKYLLYEAPDYIHIWSFLRPKGFKEPHSSKVSITALLYPLLKSFEKVKSAVKPPHLYPLPNTKPNPNATSCALFYHKMKRRLTFLLTDKHPTY